MAEDELVEGSIYTQIKAIEGWALNAYQESAKKTPNVDVILENLKKINLQARKLVEQFAKELPDLSKIKKTEDWEDFLRGEGDYAVYALDVRRKLWNEYFSKMGFAMTGCNLADANLSDFYFDYMGMDKTNFSRANLMGTSFFNSRLEKCKFDHSNLEGANFSTSTMDSVEFIGVKASKANFNGAIIKKRVNFNGNFTGADFSALTGSGLMVLDGNFNNSNFKRVAISWEVSSTLSLVNADLREAKIWVQGVVNLLRSNFAGANVLGHIGWFRRVQAYIDGCSQKKSKKWGRGNHQICLKNLYTITKIERSAYNHKLS